MANTGLDEPRLYHEIGVEARIVAMIEPIAASLGYRLVWVKIFNQNGFVLQVMAEDENGQFGIDDCETLSRQISTELDVDDPLHGSYHLEVSSPGIDRLLVRRSDFEMFKGFEAKLEARELIDGRRRFRGTLGAVSETHIEIELNDVQPGQDKLRQVPLDMLASAKLVMNDALLDLAARQRNQIEQMRDDLDVEIEVL